MMYEIVLFEQSKLVYFQKQYPKKHAKTKTPKKKKFDVNGIVFERQNMT